MESSLKRSNNGIVDPDEVMEEARSALEALAPAGGWEVYLEWEESLNIEAREGEIVSLTSAASMGLALRAAERGRVGFSFTNNLDRAGIAEAARRAAEACRHMPDSGFPGFPGPPEGGYPSLDILDEKLGAIDKKDKVQKALAIERAALSSDPRVKRVRGAEYEEVRNQVRLRNSSGIDVRSDCTLVSASAEVVAEEKGEAQAAYEFETVHYYDKLDCDYVGFEAAARASGLLGGSGMASGRRSVVLSAASMAGLISVLAPAAAGDAIMNQRSWLAGNIGRRIGSKLVNIVDDGTHEPGPGATPFDDEGTASRRTRVVSEGKLEGYLYDSHYARMAETASTGNGMRSSYYMPPAVDTSNWLLLPGGETEEGLIARVDDGLYIVEFLGLHTADPVAGEFSLGVAGFRIEKGKLGEPVLGVAVAGSLEETLQAVEGLADKVKFSGDSGAPAALIGALDISG